MKSQNRSISSLGARVAVPYRSTLSHTFPRRPKVSSWWSTSAWRAVVFLLLLTPVTTAESAGVKPQGASIPAGTKFYLRLETPVNSRTTKMHDKVTARFVRDVPTAGGAAIPMGAVATGEVEKVVVGSTPKDRDQLLLQFTEVEIPGQKALKIKAHLADVENARETVLANGTIQGVLLSEVPVSFLETAVARIGQSNPQMGETAQKMQQIALGKSDPSITYPKGTDLVLVLDEAIEVSALSTLTVPDQLPAPDAESVNRLLANAPQRASGKDDSPGDPLNLVVIGNMEQIRRVFKEAGWTEAEKKTGQSIWETVRAVAANQGYEGAPVSQLYLYGRSEDLAFEKMLNTFLKRHHLRLWRSPAATSDGREIWLGASTHDTGLDVRPGVASHAIDPDLDDERAKVGGDLSATGLVAAVQLVSRPNPLTEGLTATGAPWKTDGRLLAIELKNQ
jgi:hypothetical protein